MLPDLAPDRLYVFAFGPGVGELVAVRAPPNDWLVIDGCSAGSVAYGTRLLAHYGARPKMVVLTHPHMDHARGLGDVIDDATVGPASGWPLIGLVLPSWVRGAGDLADLPAHYQAGVGEEAVSTILDRWERVPGSRWDLHRGDRRPLGEATVEVVSPSPTARADAEQRAREHRRIEPNGLATVLLVTWRGHRVVLGSDLVDDHPEGWASAIHHQPSLVGPTVLKVAHHGSLPAQHESLLRAAEPTVLLATPYAPKGLPDFRDGQGADFLLQRSPELLLTGLPRGYKDQGVEPRRASRASLLEGGRSARRSPAVPGFPDCGCVVALHASGVIEAIAAPGSVTVTP